MTSSVCCRTRCPALQYCPPPPSWCCRPPLNLTTLLLDFLLISKEQQLLWEQLYPQLLCPAEQLWLPQLLLSQLWSQLEQELPSPNLILETAQWISLRQKWSHQ